MVIRNGGNVGASQAARLGSHFSLMMSVDVPNEQLAALKVLLNDMADMNVSVFEAEAKDAAATTPQIACTFSIFHLWLYCIKLCEASSDLTLLLF